ncbi:hypothetical protein ACF0H5_007372 [Mactra antiquata]
MAVQNDYSVVIIELISGVIVSQKFARKASSANSLRLSPPKGKGKPCVSSPNSPVHDPRRAVSSPYDLNQVEPCECITPSTEREAFVRADKAATIPRTQTESGAAERKFQPRSILKPSSTSSGGMHEAANGSKHSMNSSNNHLDTKSHVYSSSRSASAGPLTTDGNQAFSSFGKSPSKTCENIRVETAFVGNYDSSCDLEHISGRKSVTIATSHEELEIDNEVQTPVENENKSIVVHKDCIRILAPQPQKLMPESPRGGSHNSESPEWPSPPEPLTPQTPQTPTYNLEFDSDSIKKMLENLPISPETDSMCGSMNEHDQGFHDDNTCQGQNKCHGNKNNDSKSSTGQNGNEESVEVPPSTGIQLLDCEITRRKCVRDSYGRDSNPDSGIGGMCDAAASLSSGESTNLPSTVINTSDVGLIDIWGAPALLLSLL